MKRILIDENLKNLAADYVSKLPHIVGDVKARLQSLAEDLKLTSTEILIFIPKNNKKAKNNQSVRKKSSPNTIEAANAGHPLKDKQETYKGVWHRGVDYQRVSEYVGKISELYDTLNNLIPSQFDNCSNEIDSFLRGVPVENIWVSMKGQEKQSLYELVVAVMGYEKVRSELMPNYIKKIGIRTCVYCNAQFAMTTLIEDVHERIKTGKRGRPKDARVIPLMGGYYELDHNKPKSKYPYFCTNFYNLQPCCSSCNKRKSAQDLPFSLYYEDGDKHHSPLHFAISPNDVIEFHTKG